MDVGALLERLLAEEAAAAVSSSGAPTPKAPGLATLLDIQAELSRPYGELRQKQRPLEVRRPTRCSSTAPCRRPRCAACLPRMLRRAVLRSAMWPGSCSAPAAARPPDRRADACARSACPTPTPTHT